MVYDSRLAGGLDVLQMLSSILLCVSQHSKENLEHVKEKLAADEVEVEEVCAYVNENLSYLEEEGDEEGTGAFKKEDGADVLVKDVLINWLLKVQDAITEA